MNTAVTIRNATVILDGKTVLDDINLNIANGEHLFILGANGSGKTTLMRMMLGYVWPRFGAEITVLGNTFGKCNLFDVRKRVAWVSAFLQDWTNAKWPVIEIVISGIDATIGLYRHITDAERQQALTILESLGIAGLAERSFSHLSSGEQMKVLIARALIIKPSLVIFDEACVHLDLKSREFLLETIESLAQTPECPSIIFITQRIEDIAPVFSEGMILKGGKVVAEGHRDDILKESILSEAFEVNMQLIRTDNNRYWTVIG